MAYKWVPGGFLTFTDEADMLSRSDVWYLVYDGVAPTETHAEVQSDQQ